MGIHLADQTIAFLGACLLGAGLGMLYDLFRMARIAFPPRSGVVFVQDVLYFLVCAVATFFFLLTVIDGVVRVFLIFGEIIGWTLYHVTVGQLVMKVSKAIIEGVRRILSFLLRHLFLPLWKLMYTLITFLLLPFRYLGEIVKKSLRKAKFNLKIRRIVLYNQLISYSGGKGFFGAINQQGENHDKNKRKPKEKRKKEK